MHEPDGLRAPRSVSRRTMLRLAAGTAIGASGAATAHGAGTPIEQPAAATHAAFMDRALALRRRAEESGDQPFGAVIVKDGRIVGEAPSRVATANDPTAHAEMEAIRDAARRLGTRRLDGCIMYSSSRPCPMCGAASYWAGLSRLYYGSALSDGGAPRLQGC